MERINANTTLTLSLFMGGSLGFAKSESLANALNLCDINLCLLEN